MLAMSMPPPLPQFMHCMTGTASTPISSCYQDDTIPPTSSNSTVNLKRPKLSLQTSSLPTSYATSSKGLSLNTSSLASITPTTANTFSNTWDLSLRPSPISSTASPIVRGPLKHSRSESPHTSRPSDLSVYNRNISFGLRSILKNTSSYQDATRNSSALSAGPSDLRRKAFFSLPKKVGFKKELEDVIVTTKYTARHSDLLSPIVEKHSETAGAINRSPKLKHTLDHEDIEESDNSNDDSSTSPPLSKRRKGRQCSIKDVSSSVSSCAPRLSTWTDMNAICDQSPEEQQGLNIITSTPYSDRKNRLWEWTLPPVKSTSLSGSSNVPSPFTPNAVGGMPGTETADNPFEKDRPPEETHVQEDKEPEANKEARAALLLGSTSSKPSKVPVLNLDRGRSFSPRPNPGGEGNNPM